MKGKNYLRYLMVLLVAGLLLTGCAREEEEEEESRERRKRPSVTEEVTEESTEETDSRESEEVPVSEEPQSSEDPSQEETQASEGARPIVLPTVPGEEVQELLHPVIRTMNRYYYNEDRSVTYANARWAEIVLEPEEAERYPELAASLEKLASEAKESSTQEMEGCLDYAEEFVEVMGYDGGNVFEDINSIRMERCDAKVFSFVGSNHCYEGGAHGMYGYGGYNYDTATGKKLKLDDFIADKEKLTDAIYDALLLKYEADTFYYADDLLRGQIRTQIEEDYLNIVITNRGLRVYFNPYDIAPYAAGAIMVELYPEYYPDLVKAEYAGASADWIMVMPDYEGILADVNGDGVPEQVRYDWIYEGDSREATGFKVYAGEEEVAFNFWSAWDPTAYLVKSGSRYYVYLVYNSENDMHRLNVVGFTADGRPELLTEDYWGLNFSCAVKDWDYDQEGTGTIDEFYQTNFVMTDPGKMYLESWTDFFSTKNGTRCYHVGEDGLPAPNEGFEVYRFYGQPYEFTLLQDVTGKLLDDEGREIGDYTLKTGDKVTYFGTDNQTFGEVQTPDGRVIRLYMDTNENPDSWSHRINGIGIEELFDGVLFAG